MTMGKEFRNHTNQNWKRALRLLVVTATFCLPAMAVLGGDLNSVQEDAAQMKGAVKVETKDAYAIHEIKGANKMTLREYVSSDGRVFGVAWQGPFMPNMAQILGGYLSQYSAAVEQEHTKGPGRRPLNINTPGLVVGTSGHMGSFNGRAYVPQLVPQGVKAEEVR
jgi:hypothetical protein